MGPAVVTLLVIAFIFTITWITHRSNESKLNPLFVSITCVLLITQVVLFGVSWARFSPDSVSIVVVKKKLDAGHTLSETDLKTKRVDRISAENSFNTTDQAKGKVLRASLGPKDSLTTENAATFVSLALPPNSLPDPGSGRSIPTGSIDLFAAPKKAPDEPIIVEGAVLELTPNGNYVVHLTKDERVSLLAVVARSTLTIEPNED